MKGVFSHAWLQSYFDTPLPEPQTIADLLNRHAFEVDAVSTAEDGTAVYELDILPNRSVDCLAHQGIAYELGAILSQQLSRKRDAVPIQFTHPSENCIRTERCDRYATLTVKNLSLKETPSQIAERLRCIGQRGINPITDLANYFLFDIGHPVHAFDAKKVSGSFAVRQAHDQEPFTPLNGEAVTLSPEDIVITDAANDTVIALAGVIGSEATKVDETTTDIYLEMAVFDGLSIRRTTRRIGRTTDASQRFSQNLPPEIIDESAQHAIAFFSQYGTVTDSADSQRIPVGKQRVTGVSVREVNSILGTSYTQEDIAGVFDRLHFSYQYENPKEVFLKKIREQIGKPYVYGSSVTRDAPDQFDCSSLVCWAAAQAGKSIPRVSINQCLFAAPVEQPEPGDIIFTKANDPDASVRTESVQEAGFPIVHGSVAEGISHCVIITDHKTTVEAEGSGGANSVVEKPLDLSRSVRVGRLFDDEKRFIVSVPVTRPDLRDERDLIEEISRIMGYDTVSDREPEQQPPGSVSPTYAQHVAVVQKLQTLGFSEIMTSSFCKKSPLCVVRPVAKDKGCLRTALRPGTEQALEQAAYYGDLLGLDTVRVMEVGTVFSEDGMSMHIALGVCPTLGRKAVDMKQVEQEVRDVVPIPGGFDGSVWEVPLADIPLSGTDTPFTASDTIRYKTPSKYPFVLRDLAVFVPDNTDTAAAEECIREYAGEYLRQVSLFDEFTKDGKTSYAFRLVFQSDTETLDDKQVTASMEHLTRALEDRGFIVR
ncbi:MAG: phenylalanine--tRNA ligase beta subunit-related protein [Candidatus Kaiserbacteria bacterium]|nr:phenylalanine--tRNA ligase beta subunit-related protein [Candidatus Kaiserbacteria bacterium]